MGRNTSYDVHIDRRRREVAALRLRKYTQVEITEELPKRGIVNPKTGKGYDLAQINRDLKAIQTQWKSDAKRDMGTLKAEHLAELKEVRREAWNDKKPRLFYVLKSLEQEARVAGLEEQDITDMMGMLADSFLAGANTMEQMNVPDLSE